MTLEAFTLADPPAAELQYTDFALDPATWDLIFPINILRGADAVIQKIQVRFQFFLGEWFLDQRLGVPYYRDILIKNPDTLVISSIFRAVLLSVPGVNKVNFFRAVLDRATRILSCDFEAILDDGSIVKATDEPFIITGS